MVDAFVQLLLVVGQVQSDVIGDLPTEIGAKIFRYLDNESLVSAAGVNRRWNSICKGDPVLRRRIRKKLQKDRKERVHAYRNAGTGIQVIRRDPAVMFGRRNGMISVKVSSVQYEEVSNRKAPQMRRFKIRKVDSIAGAVAKKNYVDANNNVNYKKAMRL